MKNVRVNFVERREEFIEKLVDRMNRGLEPEEVIANSKKKVAKAYTKAYADLQVSTACEALNRVGYCTEEDCDTCKFCEWYNKEIGAIKQREIGSILYASNMENSARMAASREDQLSLLDSIDRAQNKKCSACLKPSCRDCKFEMFIENKLERAYEIFEHEEGKIKIDK